MHPAPAAIIDTLNGLLEAELSSIFRFMGEGSPYLSKATAEVRKPLQDMVNTIPRRTREIADLIDSLGGVPTPRNILPEEQYLAYLSLKFLLPKLVSAEELLIKRYENAVRALKDAPPEVITLVKRELAEHKSQLDILKNAAEQVAKTK
ncbi:MAG TPA: hypothetical protein VL282_19015 [Tepidisphaeraceae bacterium]|nr:hypothetical protein [Tepidisphaeraceae bacterium]